MSGFQTHNFSGDRYLWHKVVVNPPTIRARIRRFLILRCICYLCCCCNWIEDEHHFVLVCPAYRSARCKFVLNY